MPESLSPVLTAGMGREPWNVSALDPARGTQRRLADALQARGIANGPAVVGAQAPVSAAADWSSSPGGGPAVPASLAAIPLTVAARAKAAAAAMGAPRPVQGSEMKLNTVLLRPS